MTKTLNGNYFNFLQAQYGLNSTQLNDFLHIKDNHLYCQDIDLAQLAQKWGSPLEVGFTPLVTRQVHKMYGYFAHAFQQLGYQGNFIYAYATKAAQYEDLVRTALGAGAHYETSSPTDISMARLHWKAGNLPDNRLIICNGFKTEQYVQNILDLRREGFRNVLPVIESEHEIEDFARSGFDFNLGIRLRVDESILQQGDFSQVKSRFGIPHDRVLDVAAQIASKPNLHPVMFHAMIGTQCINRQEWVKALLICFRQYCELKRLYPSMASFNFGGGMPVPYSLDFQFDYQAFATELTQGMMELCAEYGIPHPNLVGEFGRYTAAAYGFDFYKVVVSKPSHREDVSWYVINGSLMSSLPDIWGLKQTFIILPLNGYDRPLRKVWLAGLTCDSDDVYQSEEEDGTVWLPDVADGTELTIGVFMTGAYQDMLSGIGGVHHCLLPEPSELVIEGNSVGNYTYRQTAPSQSLHAIASLLGYRHYLPLLHSSGHPAELNSNPHFAEGDYHIPSLPQKLPLLANSGNPIRTAKSRNPWRTIIGANRTRKHQIATS
ncbi:MAG: arginine decarboxylase [Chloroflexi bacterium]|nr:arginine decarboxylase [Chloroflexota bacterium]